jgi:hypothetical protein
MTDRVVGAPDQHGTNLVALQDGTRLEAEAKGAGSSKPNTARYGQPFTAAQVRVHVGEAALKALRSRPQGMRACGGRLPRYASSPFGGRTRRAGPGPPRRHGIQGRQGRLSNLRNVSSAEDSRRRSGDDPLHRPSSNDKHHAGDDDQDPPLCAVQ